MHIFVASGYSRRRPLKLGLHHHVLGFPKYRCADHQDNIRPTKISRVSCDLKSSLPWLLASLWPARSSAARRSNRFELTRDLSCCDRKRTSADFIAQRNKHTLSESQQTQSLRTGIHPSSCSILISKVRPHHYCVRPILLVTCQAFKPITRRATRKIPGTNPEPQCRH